MKKAIKKVTKKEETPKKVIEAPKKIEGSPEKVIEAPKKIEETPKGVSRDRGFNIEEWKPVTKIGMKIKAGKIKDIDEVLDRGIKILEPGIIDALIPSLQADLLAFGQSKGKFGGGKRSIWRQTQKKTKEGNKPSFSAFAVVGNRDGYIGIGTGKAKETVPAREKATRKAKLNVIKVVRGCGSWECGCGTPHSIPFKVTGKSGSIKVTLIPAPKGKSIIAEKECQKIIKLAGIKDVYTKTLGHTATKSNLLKACFNALKKLSTVKVQEEYRKKAGIKEGLLE